MKNIIVTGANQGIGYYMTEELLSQGYNVTVLDFTNYTLLFISSKDGKINE